MTTKNEPEEAIIDAELTITLEEDPLIREDLTDQNWDSVKTNKQTEENDSKKLSEQQCLDDTILPVLPRSPTLDEQKQRFIMYKLPTDPNNFMR